MKTLNIELGHTSYPIFIDSGTTADASIAARVREYCPNGRAAVISDENVWELHKDRLEGLGIELLPIIVKPGEGSKSMQTLERVYAELCAHGLKRSEPIIAFGGGVVGDLAGFAAATYMRGANFIQIPTTLLAQVDSSVGGKVAVNLEQGKNMVGSFYQPKMVIIDTDMLDTLPKREFAAGMAEVIKYAAIDDCGVLEILEADEPHDMQEIIYLCCKSKAGVVERDELDMGERMILNFGHTFGHAIEKLNHYEKYNHGEAVALGMMLAARVGVRMGKTAAEVPDRIAAMLKRADLCDKFEDVAAIIPLMSGDKKNSGALITLVLVSDMGQPFVCEIGMDELAKMVL